VIRVRDIQRSFGRVRAVRGISFAVDAGEVVGLVGPNGAGKTTTLRILTGFLDPDAGSAEIAGHDVVRDRDAARAALGYMAESVPLYPEMRVRDYLAFRARIKRVPRRRLRARVDAALEHARVADHARVVIGTLSRGYRQRVGLADALVADPPVLILDEPTAGLDPMQVRELRALVAELSRERAVLFSSHVLAEVESMASRLVVVARGRVVASGRPAEVRERAGVGDGATLEDAFVALVGAAEAA
jgi:ABC-2 type transport system ATP-binding protein